MRIGHDTFYIAFGAKHMDKHLVCVIMFMASLSTLSMLKFIIWSVVSSKKRRDNLLTSSLLYPH